MKTGTKNSIIFISVLGLFSGLATTAFAGYFNTSPVVSCGTTITRTLQVGSSGNDVYTLQNFLSQSGYLNVSPNGNFGPSTKQAVKRFQADNGIYAGGGVGEATRNAINEQICGDGNYSASYSNYGYSNGTTYVDAFDPYVKVINPPVANPVVYTNPGSNFSSNYVTNTYGTTGTNFVQPNLYSTPTVNLPAPTIPQIQSTGIIYSPYIGYTHGIVPQSGSLTITSPGVNSHYNEGDTVNLAWSTTNFNASQYQILLENTSSGQSKFITTTSGNSTSFVLTKDLLDAVCGGVNICENNQFGSFRIVITTPFTDITGITSTFRAMVSPITIKRPLGFFGTVSMTGSKNPVNTSEVFKLYVNIPGNISRNRDLYGQYSFRLRAICPPSATVSIAGVVCGQEFSIPFSTSYFQQEIPAVIVNTTYYKQDVIFEIFVSNNAGQVVGTARTTVTVNPAPFSW